MKKRILFYSSVKTMELFQFQRFYQIDVKLLQELNYEIKLSNKISDAFFFWKYDLVYAYFYKWSFFVGLIAKVFFKKVFFTGGIDDLSQNYATRKRFIIQEIGFKLCYFISTSCIIVSESDRINVEHICKKQKHKKLSYSEHTIDVDSFCQQKIEKENLFTTIAWMGNGANIDRKGLDVAVNVFAYLKTKPEFIHYHFNIIGTEGEGSQILRNLVSTLNLSESVHFVGAVSEEAKIELLRKSKYYFQLSKYEGFGIAAVESMASRNIVIHSSMGGLKYTINDSGIIFDISGSLKFECEKLYCNLLLFDNQKLDQVCDDVHKRFSNERRKMELDKILSQNNN